jgi:perosamine synthetase
LIKIFSKITHLLTTISRQAIGKTYFGFVSGHWYLTPKELEQIKATVGKVDGVFVTEFEREFAAIIGEGNCVSYAAGRMGFYAVMRALGIGTGDEVILTGATCSVMVNAVLRTGATPIFSDIDPNTLGSSPISIAQCITSQTCLIVAQHSFGIPCDIIPIVELAKAHKIFLLEDCALTLGSKANNIVVGNFGDAALFSTDHSKPINTITGGMIYTSNPSLTASLRQSLSFCDVLPLVRQQALWRRLLLERSICNPARYQLMEFFDLFLTLCYKFFGVQQPFLSDDFSSSLNLPSYPYPAKMPEFLALVGLCEIRQWPNQVILRKRILEKLLDIVKNSNIYPLLPSAYHDANLDIIPLRLAWADTDGVARRKLMRGFIHTPWTWFMQPIVATNEPLENYGYKSGACLISENIGLRMVNLPCNVPDRYNANFFKMFKSFVK